MKQVIVARADLGMSKVKLAAQASHASIGAYKKADDRIIREWELEGGKKVVVQVKSQQELFEIYELVKAAEIQLPGNRCRPH
jgi:PTH2 family peptidyl-tRNA hydrolase